ncbi:MAG: RidA family protein [Betaproteobacteria bacterium]|jgi:enamine deaminase RidA (YjgF/YER057c/UK114 family)
MHKKINPPNWAQPKGYSNAILATGSILFLGGQIGWNYNNEFESDDFIDQAKQALLNVSALLTQAGATPEHMTRMTWYITNRDEYNSKLKELGVVYREVMGKNFPVMTCVEVSALVEERAKIEIEVTAVI